MGGAQARWTIAIITSLSAGCSLFLGDSDDDGPGADASPPDTALVALGVSRGALAPPFDPAITDYSLILPLGAEDLALTPTAADPDRVRIEVAGVEVPSGVASAPLPLALGDGRLEVVVTPETGDARVYAVAVNRGAGLLQRAYVKASNISASDRFASSVAVDDNTLVVGAPLEDSSTTGIDPVTDDIDSATGAVYVFVRNGEVWTQQALIKPEVIDSSDRFGTRVDIDGDTLVVGAPFEDSDSTSINGGQLNDDALSAGAAYVFVRAGDTWSQEAYIKGSFVSGNDTFGDAVSIDGDTLAVGAPLDDSGATGVNPGSDDNGLDDTGAVYVFVRSSASWSEQAHIKASNTGIGDRFGASVSIDGDTLAVGAPDESSSAPGIGGDQQNDNAGASGAVYIFGRDTATWTQQAYVKASNPGTGDRFGTSVSVEGDTLAVGAPDEDSTSTGIDGANNDDGDSNGAVYVFFRAVGDWSQQAYIKASTAYFDARFGGSVAIDNDVLVVGATGDPSGSSGVNGPEDDTSAPGAGAAYLFTRTDGSWTQQAYIKASNPDGSDSFGFAVAVEDTTIAIGANRESSADPGDQSDNTAGEAGAAYVLQ